jgi:hypothetical protein
MYEVVSSLSLQDGGRARNQPPILAEELWSCSTVALPIGSR